MVKITETLIKEYVIHSSFHLITVELDVIGISILLLLMMILRIFPKKYCQEKIFSNCLTL